MEGRLTMKLKKLLGRKMSLTRYLDSNPLKRKVNKEKLERQRQAIKEQNRQMDKVAKSYKDEDKRHTKELVKMERDQEKERQKQIKKAEREQKRIRNLKIKNMTKVSKAKYGKAMPDWT